MSDTQLLNWLESQGTPGLLWLARKSINGRGYRLHQVTEMEAALWGGHRCSDTPQGAIQMGMARQLAQEAEVARAELCE